jgi:hypothetical protein
MYWAKFKHKGKIYKGVVETHRRNLTELDLCPVRVDDTIYLVPKEKVELKGGDKDE